MDPAALALRALEAHTPAELGAAMHAPAASRMRAALAVYEARIAREIEEDERGRRRPWDADKTGPWKARRTG